MIMKTREISNKSVMTNDEICNPIIIDFIIYDNYGITGHTEITERLFDK